MIDIWGPGRNAADGYFEFARGAVRWDGPADGDLRFLVFGNPGWDEHPFRRRERRLLRRGLRDLGCAVCESEEYLNPYGDSSWALVVRPEEQPRDEEAARLLEARLNALVWTAVARAQGIPPRAADEAPTTAAA